MTPPRRLCFVHLSKTGGKSMYRLLEHAYGSRARYVPIRSGGRVREVLDAGASSCVYGAFPYVRTEGWSYATIVRDPVERVCSYYRWLQGKDPAQHPGADLARGSLEDFVETRWPRIENAQAAQLAGYGIDPPTSLKPGDVRAAMSAIEDIEHVGTTERYEDFVRSLGLPTDDIPRLNATTAPDEPYPAEVLRAIRRRNHIDGVIHALASMRVTAAGAPS